MRAITNGQVEGFPSPEEVRTFYVEHDIDGSEEDTTVLQFIINDTRIQATESETVEALASVGFNDERQKTAFWWLGDEARACPRHAFQSRYPLVR